MSSSLYEFLDSNDFYLDRQIAQLIQLKLNSSRKVFLLRGPAGVGKTQLTYLISKFLNAKYVFHQCTYGSDSDDLLYKYVPSEETKSGIKITLGPIPLALTLSSSSKVVLCIDEFDKTRPSADALLLDLLQNFRLTLYLDEKEIIQGNPENLVIFLTSNDMREFSEPLLRRVTIIHLQPLPTPTVYKLLSKFNKEIAILLTQIYDDTIKAGLRKPATVQELYELGEILQNNLNTGLDLELLLRSVIVKYDDDWDKYLQYIKFRKPYKFIQDGSQDHQNLVEYYRPPQPDEGINEVISFQEQQNDNGSNLVIEEIRKFLIPTKFKDFKPEEVDEKKEVKEVYMLVEDNDKDAYTAVIKKLMPNPTDRPDEFDKFKVYFDDQKVFMTSKDPLSVKEILDLKDSELSGEFYSEDIYKLVDINKVYNTLIKDANKINYYSNKLLRVTMSSLSSTSISVIEVEVVKRYDHLKNIADIAVRHYIKGKIKNAYVLTPIRDFPKSDTIFHFESFERCKKDIVQLLRFIDVLQFTITFTDDCSKMRWEVDDEFAPTSVYIVFGSYIAKLLNQIGFEIKYNHPITDKQHIAEILMAVLSLKA